MNEPHRIDRREAIKWVMTAGATVSLLNFRAFGAPAAGAAAGYGTDPDLLKYYEPGDLWPLSFNPDQRRLVSVLCDLILPADDKSPGASSVGVVDFIDEWISAPYPEQQSDRQQVLDGLQWLDQEARGRFGKNFVALTAEQQGRICDDICDPGSAQEKFKTAAQFFSKFRNLTAGGFYTTPEGWKDLQYIGNVPLTKFEGPTPEVLAYLKLT